MGYDQRLTGFRLIPCLARLVVGIVRYGRVTSIRSTIDRYKKACSDDSNFGTVTEINAQESAKLRQQIQMLQNSNRHLMGDSLSSLTVKELRNWRTGLSEASLGSGPRRRLSWKMKVCVSDQRYANQFFIAQMERFQQANMVTGQELNAIHALASRNFFSSAIIEGGGTAYSHPDKKILYLG
ncbi:Agamous-like MADS-box protein AGL11 [Citrus sinensis]|nr:Agamous-like MADS-box protein AGL11 [Citrus sinensis]